MTAPARSIAPISASCAACARRSSCISARCACSRCAIALRHPCAEESERRGKNAGAARADFSRGTPPRGWGRQGLLWRSAHLLREPSGELRRLQVAHEHGVIITEFIELIPQIQRRAHPRPPEHLDRIGRTPKDVCPPGTAAEKDQTTVAARVVDARKAREWSKLGGAHCLVSCSNWRTRARSRSPSPRSGPTRPLISLARSNSSRPTRPEFRP